MKKQLLFILLLFCGCLAAEEQANGFPVSRIVQRNGVSCIEVDGEIINPVHFWTVARRDKSERNAAEIAGLRLIAVSLPDAIADDHDAVADLLAYHLERNPDARLILYVNFDPVTRIVMTGIADENVTMKLGAPLMEVNVDQLTRDEFKLKIFNMLLLADEIAVLMGNLDLRKMSNIQIVKTYLNEIYDKFHENP